MSVYCCKKFRLHCYDVHHSEKTWKGTLVDIVAYIIICLFCSELFISVVGPNANNFITSVSPDID